MSESLVIPCPHCDGLNRLPAERLGDAPRCGRCKSAVLPNAPFALSQASFASQLKGDLPLLVDVWADWCGPCKMIAPVYEAASEQHPDVTFGKVDTEDQQAIAAAANIRSIPTLMAFRDGILVFANDLAGGIGKLEQVITAVKGLDMDEVRAQVAAAEAQADS